MVGVGLGGDGGCQECAELAHEEKKFKLVHLSKTQTPV